jgi:hypothetical protein
MKLLALSIVLAYAFTPARANVECTSKYKNIIQKISLISDTDGATLLVTDDLDASAPHLKLNFPSCVLSEPVLFECGSQDEGAWANLEQINQETVFASKTGPKKKSSQYYSVAYRQEDEDAPATMVFELTECKVAH